MKKWLIALVIVAVILIALFTAAGIFASRGYGVSTGVYLEAKDDTAMLIRENSPIVLSGKAAEACSGKLDTGDRILVFHDGINESYPGSTRAYAVWKLRAGTSADVPAAIIEQLMELGWLESTPN